MKRIVLDTNCLIQILPKKSKYRKIWNNILSEETALCVTTDILNEYHEILSYFFSETLAENVINTILNLSKTELIEVFYFWNLIEKDPDDNKYVDCAVSANAQYIVTEDKHFNILKTIEFPKLSVIKLDAFLKKQ